MPTLYITHEAFLHHDTGFWHPERPDRIRAVEKALSTEVFQNLIRVEAPLATHEQIGRVHHESYMRWLDGHRPESGLIAVDGGDTIMSPGTWEAALRAAGAARLGVDEVMAGSSKQVFCAVRPPGHHAEPAQAMGFCFFNSVAIAAFHARAQHGAKRIAVVDFDVHHGNGTQTAFWNEPDFLYISVHQYGPAFFPGTGSAGETGAFGNVLNLPLDSGSGSKEFRDAFESSIIPRLQKHRPDLILLSAGFDAHSADPLGNLRVTEEDFAFATRMLLTQAKANCEGRIISVLEGGYDLDALGRCVATHVKTIMEG